MTAKTKSKKPTRKRAPKKSKTEEVAPAEVAAAAPAAAEAPLPDEAFTPPEITFSARVPSLPDRPRPSRRRVIFIDVENTSRPGRITEALEDLRIDHADAHTDIVASGNWRVIANETARLLARKGAQLVHSAPATGVRDWSDLRIAVGAGVWLASARPGDRLDIVSDDKAFDAVGDVAATLGVEFFRHTKKRGAAQHAVERAAPAPRTRGGRSRGGRGRGRGRGRQTETAQPPAEAAPIESVAEAKVAATASEQPGTAPSDDLLRVVREMLEASPNGVTLDAVANHLKKLGFVRPPGSPRLVTRLRTFKDLNVSDRGLIRLAGGAEAKVADGAPPEQRTDQRRRRRGGRGRGRRSGAASTDAGAPAAESAPETSAASIES